MKTEEEIKKAIKDAEINISMAQERIEDEENYCKRLGQEIELLKWVLTPFISLPKVKPCREDTRPIPAPEEE